MVRCWRLIALVALVAGFGMLAFPADGSALAAVFITLTPTGPSPDVLTIPQGLYPVWTNPDTVPHTVVFGNGLCLLQVVPAGEAQCSIGFTVGDYPYVVDGAVQARIVVVAAPPLQARSVTLSARSHTIRRGEHLNLQGRLKIPSWPAGSAPEQPIIILARHDRRHPFRRIASVLARSDGSKSLWRLRVGPHGRTIYIAEAAFQPPPPFAVWQRAWSRPFKILVSR